MTEQIYKFAFSFIRQEAKSAARLLEELEPKEVAEFLSNAPQPLAAIVLKEMLPSACVSVLLAAELSTTIIWLSELANNHVCAILRHMNKSKQNELLDQLSIKRRTACKLLLNYNDDMLGAWVETDVPAFPRGMTVEETIKRLKRKSYKDDRVIFVVDDKRRPIGTLSIAVLLRSAKSLFLENLARMSLQTISGSITLPAAMGHSIWQTYDVVPVVNRRKELIGVIGYSQIRHLLSSQSFLLESSSAPIRGAALEVVQAFGESMCGLMEVVRNGVD